MARDLQKVLSAISSATAFFCGLLPVAVLAQDPPSTRCRLNYLSGPFPWSRREPKDGRTAVDQPPVDHR